MSDTHPPNPAAEPAPAEPTAAERRAVGLAERMPYLPRGVRARRDLVDWAQAHRLRYSSRGRCLHWLRTGRCARGDCARIGGWTDHLSGWTRDGTPAVLVAQPYGLNDDDHAELDGLARDGLDVQLDPDGGWYGHGTTFIGLWRQPRHPDREQR